MYFILLLNVTINIKSMCNNMLKSEESLLLLIPAPILNIKMAYIQRLANHLSIHSLIVVLQFHHCLLLILEG